MNRVEALVDGERAKRWCCLGDAKAKLNVCLWSSGQALQRCGGIFGSEHSGVNNEHKQ